MGKELHAHGELHGVPLGGQIGLPPLPPDIDPSGFSASEQLSLFLQRLIPTNLVKAAADGQLLGLIVFSVFTVLMWACNLIIWGTIIQAVMSWVNPMAPIMPFKLAATILPRLAASSPDFSRAGIKPIKMRRLSTMSKTSTSASCTLKI